MMLIYLYETTALTDAEGGTEAVRLAFGGGYNHPTAPGYYADHMMQGDSIKFVRSIYRDRLGFGMGSVDAGVITAQNATGEYDWTELAGFGQRARLLLGERDGAYEDFTVVATGRSTSALVGMNSVKIGWKDRAKTLDERVSLGSFAGTNSGTTGLEGTENDIKGQTKPRAWGKLLDIEPVLVNSSLRIFGWNNDRDGARAATHSIDAVRDRGAAWTFGANYADAAALAATAPTQGIYNTCLAESLILMGGSVEMRGVRIDVTIGDTGENYAGAIIQTLLEELGEDSDTINLTELAALDTASDYLQGYYARENSVRDVIDALLKGILAYGAVDSLGVYRFGFVPSATGTAVATLRRGGLGVVLGASDVNIVSIEPVLDTGSKNIPAKSVQVRYAHRWSVIDKSNLADALDDQDKLELSTPWRVTDEETNGIEAQFPDAEQVQYDTYLVDETDAEAVRDALLAIVGQKQRIFRATVAAQPNTVNLFQPGALIDCYHPRFGLSDGYQFFITSVAVDSLNRRVSLTMQGVGSV